MAGGIILGTRAISAFMIFRGIAGVVLRLLMVAFGALF